MEDLTPHYKSASAEQEITLPQPASAAGTQVFGGFNVSPTQLKQGNVTLNGVGEQILIGAATASMTGIGIFMGNDGAATVGYDFRVGDPSGNYIFWDASAASLTVVGTLSVTAINIPDQTTANSFHTDSSGNSWWGSNVAGGTSTAKAYILNTGAAYFQNVQVGGTNYQYTMNDTGVYTFGDGSDGAVTLDASTNYNNFSTHVGVNYTLTRDVFATNLTINNTVILKTAGYRIFCQGTLHLLNGGTINRDGNDAVTSVAGAALADGYLKGGVAGAIGGDGGRSLTVNGNGNPGTAGTVGASVSNSLGQQTGGASGTGGGSGGVANAFSGGGSGAGNNNGVRTARNIAPVLQWNFMSFFDINADGTLSKYNSGVGASGGGGGGGGALAAAGPTSGQGGDGGAGGGSGGIIAIYARAIILDSGCHIYARGGRGGNGGNASAPINGGASPQAGGAGGGGGGGGGAGGIVFLVYNTLTNNGTIDATGGAGGTKGTASSGINGGSGGSDGNNGDAGIDGVTYQINMAL